MAEETTPNAQQKDDNAAKAQAANTTAPGGDKSSGEQSKAAKTTAPSDKKDADKDSKKLPAKGKAAGKKAKEKVEDKPFNEFIEEDFLPALEEALAQQDINDMELNFVKQPLAISGSGAVAEDECWQVVGKWQEGQRQFNLYFIEEDIKGQKAFSYATSGAKASTVESFMIDERRVTLDLLVLYVVQRLNGQKWLVRN